MTHRVPFRIIQLALGAVFLLAGLGCATTSDMQTLQSGLNQKFEVMNDELHAEVGRLRSALQANQAAHQDLHKDLVSTLDALRADTKAAVEEVAKGERTRSQVLTEMKAEAMKTQQVVREYGTASTRAFKKIAVAIWETNDKLRAVRQAVETIESLPSLVAGVGEEVHSLRQALAETFRIEETALRDRLTVLEHLRGQLTPLQAREETGSIGPGKAALASGG